MAHPLCLMLKRVPGPARIERGGQKRVNIGGQRSLGADDIQCVLESELPLYHRVRELPCKFLKTYISFVSYILLSNTPSAQAYFVLGPESVRPDPRSLVKTCTLTLLCLAPTGPKATAGTEQCLCAQGVLRRKQEGLSSNSGAC